MTGSHGGVRWKIGAALGVAAAATCLADTSHAQPAGGERQPVPYVERPIALPAMTLAPGGQLHLFRVPNFAGRDHDPQFFLSAGARFGIIDELEVELYPFQSVLAPEFQYGGSAGITADFLDGPFELGARLRGYWSPESVWFTPSMPIRIHLAEVVRIDTGAALSVSTLGEAGLFQFTTIPSMVEPGIPADVAFQIVDPFWAGLGTGFGIADFSNANDRIFVPLGFKLGGTVPSDEGPMLDIEAGFRFPYFIRSGAPDTVVSEVWDVGLNVQGYIYL